MKARFGLATILWAPALAAALSPSAAAAQPAQPATGGVAPDASAIELVTLPSPGSPIVSIRAMFRVGSMDDPKGKEGLAGLTTAIVGEGATAQRSYKELVEALYPLAASVQSRADREVSLFTVEVHRDRLEELTALLVEVLTRPGFAEADFERHRKQAESYLTTTLRAANDELLGLEVLQQKAFAGHPYGHAPEGTVAGLAAITLDDVKGFWRERFTAGNLMLGVAGGYPEGYPERLAAALAALPRGPRRERALPPAPRPQGREVTLVEKETASVGIHFGHPLAVTRADDDFYPLMLAASYLGEHRTSHGRLYQQIRGLRGLNYGDYAYVEHYHLPPFTTNPTPNVPRRQQLFSVWVRPVQPEAAHFALRAALHETERLIGQGMTAEEVELTRAFLVNYSKLWAQTLSSRLGFLMDSRYYGMPYWIDEIEKRLAPLTAAQVNAAVRRHLQTDDLEVVLVSDGAAALAAKLRAEGPASVEYAAPPPAEVTEADRTIQTLPVKPRAIETVPVGKVFEK